MLRVWQPAQTSLARCGVSVNCVLASGAAGFHVEVAPQTELPPVQVVVAPLMGVFFRAPAPDRPPFVAVAERVEIGQQIAVIEAMKLMNPVLADRAGVVREVHVADGEVVEFDQPLISIEPA